MRRLWLGFVLFVALPTALCAVYFTVLRTPIYSVEARLTVRNSQSDVSLSALSGAAAVLSRVGIGSAGGDSRDNGAVRDFIESRDAILKVGGVERLSRVWSGSEVDPLSRLRANPSLEDAWRYWHKRISVYLDNATGIIVLRVEAFRPEDAQAIAADLVSASEELLNQMSLRARGAALAGAGADVDAAMRDMAQSRAELLDFQRRTGIIDPVKTILSMGNLMKELRESQVDLQLRIATSENVGARDLPVTREQQARISVLEQQISDLQDQLTGASRDDSMTRLLRDYELLRLDEQVHSNIYEITSEIYQSARKRMAEQQRYLVEIVRPTLPDEPSNAAAPLDTFLTFCSLLVLWGIATLLWSALRDY